MSLRNGNGGYIDPVQVKMGEVPPLQDRVPYQTTLRVLGSFLDEERARRINLMEVADGFAARYQHDRDNPDSILARFTFPEISKLERDLAGRRRGRFNRSGSTQSAYENILRALGYELDDAGAYSILVDEIDEGMVVTYQYLKPTEGFNARKRMVIMGAEAMQSVLDAAHARREQRLAGILTLLAG